MCFWLCLAALGMLLGMLQKDKFVKLANFVVQKDFEDFFSFEKVFKVFAYLGTCFAFVWMH